MKKKGLSKMGIGIFFTFLFFHFGGETDPNLTINIYKGWNLISSPIEETLGSSELQKHCKLLTQDDKVWIWAYDPEMEWTNPSRIEKDEGVYVYALKNCELELEGTPAALSYKHLKKGWNLFSAEKSFEEIKGDCQLAPNNERIWEFNAKTQEWIGRTLTDKLDQRKGYWIEAADDCALHPKQEITETKRPEFILFLLKDVTVCNIPEMGCLNLKLDNKEISSIKNEIYKTVSEIYQWTKGAININLKITEIPAANINLSRWDEGWYAAPWDVKELLAPFITIDADFVAVTHDVYDDTKQEFVPIPYCGGTIGPDYGVNGAGYNWVPKTESAYPFECANKNVYTHEWLNLANLVLENISGIEDIYKGNYPACKAGDPDTYKWFPSASEDTYLDPDYEACGNTNYCELKGWDDEKCSANWHKHILEKHYDPSTDLIGNHCRNEMQDFGEENVDCGGICGTCRITPP